MVPLSLLKNVSVFAILAFSVTTRFCLLVFCYYIPIYYQAGRGQTAVQSGVALMPLLLSAVTAVILAGQFVGRTGNYWCFLFFGPIFTCVGSGLFYSVTEHTPSANIIGYQILLGLGIGSTMQNGLLAVQSVESILSLFYSYFLQTSKFKSLIFLVEIIEPSSAPHQRQNYSHR